MEVLFEADGEVRHRVSVNFLVSSYILALVSDEEEEDDDDEGEEEEEDCY